MKAELVNYFGNDDMVVDVARVSYGKEAVNYSDERNEKLINYLHKHKHTAPFRHPKLQFRIQCPIYVERQVFKHEKGIEKNSKSGRYVDFSDTYYKIPIGDWRKQSKSSKQGSEGLVGNQLLCSEIQDSVIQFCKNVYNSLIEQGVSKEQARTVLPLSLNTQFIWTGSLQAFFHLCHLRLKPDAQAETRYLVQMMLDEVKNIAGNPFVKSLKAFGYE